MSTASAPLIDATTILSLLSTLAILGLAYTLSLYSLSPTSTRKTRILFVWHAFDALIHFILEGSYLYNCFFSYLDLSLLAPTSSSNPQVSAFLAPNVHVLGHATRLYGAEYGASPFSALWREYAKADHRWAGTDLTIVSLELLTVFLAGPCAVWICCCLAGKGRWAEGRAWFWMVVLATGEIYGGMLAPMPWWWEELGDLLRLAGCLLC